MKAGAETEGVDLVISGGYKLYGVALAPLAEIADPRRASGLPPFRLLYVHEEGAQLMQYRGGRLQLGDADSPSAFRLDEPGGLE